MDEEHMTVHELGHQSDLVLSTSWWMSSYRWEPLALDLLMDLDR